MSKGKPFFKYLLALAFLVLLLWLCIPQSIYRVIGAPEKGIRRAYVHITKSTFGENGPDILSYSVNTEELEPEVLSELLTILEGNGHRPDIRNLLPWRTQDLTATGTYTIASITLVWGSTPESARHLSMLKTEEFGISTRHGLFGGFDVFRPADQETLEKLCAFAVKYGQEQS